MNGAGKKRPPSGTRRCPDCWQLVLVVASERGGQVLLNKDPDPNGWVIFERAQTAAGDVLGARRARLIRDGEELKPGVTKWTKHARTCPARKRRKVERDREQRELWSPMRNE